MKNIPENLQTHLQQEVTTLAFCWKIIFQDNVILGFTAHDENIVFEGITYKSNTGFTFDQYKTDLSGKADLLEIFGILDSDDLTEDDIRSGRIDNAILEVFMLNYLMPEDGRILVKKGKVAQVVHSDDGYVLGIKGIADELQKIITEIYSPLCRARFGDSRCGKAIDDYVFSGSITEIINDNIFIDSSRTENMGFFDKGIIKFLSGDNAGSTTIIKRSEAVKIYLSIPFMKALQVGDEFQLTVGCDKKFTTCQQKFNNVVNFRGEPHIPGVNEVFKVL